jgi:serine/threonine-protein kinase
MLHPAERFDRYVIDELLGEGGMGRVYSARDDRLRRRVALKVLRVESQGSDPLDRLLHEARAAAALHHANTIAIYDVGEVEGTPFIAMELVEGRSLRAVMGDPAVSVDTRVRYLADIARGLHAGHARGILHRDVKPENVLVRNDGVIKVVDFGIARSLESRGEDNARDPGQGMVDVRETMTRSGLFGTPRYMAPEQLLGGPLDARTDQFAWGVVAYELLTGCSPWDEGSGMTSLRLLTSIVGDVPAPLEPLSSVTTPTVAATVRRALSKRPAERFGSMAEIVDALSYAAAPTSYEPGKRRKLAPLVAGIDVCGALIRAVLGGFGTFRSVGLKYAGHFGVVDEAGRIGADEWSSQAAWLAAHERIISEIGGGMLFNIGQNIPAHARDWPAAADIEAAMKALDVAYHLNHRRDGKVMFDPATGAMTEGIGHYAAAREVGAKRITLTADNPYPCELDHGIITAIARRYEPNARVEHTPLGCRTLGAAACTYVVTWE